MGSKEVMKTKTVVGKCENGHHRGYEDQNGSLENAKTVIIGVMKTKTVLRKCENGHHRGFEDQNQRSEQMKPAKIPFAAIFDMDGTLLQTEKVAVPAFKKTFEALKEQGEFQGELPSDEKFTSVFGMTLEDIWKELLPGQSKEVHLKADGLMLKYELEILQQEDVHLYPHVKQTLQELKQQGIHLFVASNGQDEYIRAICERFEISELFTDLYSAGRFQTDSKDDLVAKLLHDHQIQKAVMVGDRKSDIQAGKANGLYTVGCCFGFADEGELAGADQLIHSFQEMKSILKDRLAEGNLG